VRALRRSRVGRTAAIGCYYSCRSTESRSVVVQAQLRGRSRTLGKVELVGLELLGEQASRRGWRGRRSPDT
jgi:hypothetical protein